MGSKKVEYVIIKFRNLEHLRDISSTGLELIYGLEYDKARRALQIKGNKIILESVLLAKVVDEKKYMLAKIKNHKIFG